jgi:hypothetical protein
MSGTQTREEELSAGTTDALPSPREAEDGEAEFEFEPTIVRGRE